MSMLTDRAYKYDKFNCATCECYYLVLFDKNRDKVFFMCAECTGCIDVPVGEARLQESTFTMEGRSFDEYSEASLEQIRSAGLDLKHVFKRNKAGEGEYVEK